MGRLRCSPRDRTSTIFQVRAFLLKGTIKSVGMKGWWGLEEVGGPLKGTYLLSTFTICCLLIHTLLWGCSSNIAAPSALGPSSKRVWGEIGNYWLISHKKYMELPSLWCLPNYAHGIVSQWRPPGKRGMSSGGFAICVWGGLGCGHGCWGRGS